MRLFIIIFITSLEVFCISQELISVSKVCDTDCNPDYVKNRLIDKEISGDTTILTIGLVENCDITPVFHFRNSEDTLFFSIENGSGFIATCECCFEFQVKLVGLSDSNFLLIHEYVSIEKAEFGFEKVNLSEVLNHHENKYVFPTSDELNATFIINQTNDKGMRIGLWQEYYDGTGIIKSKTFYTHDPQGNSKRMWTAFFDEKGNLKEVCATRKKHGMLYNICIDSKEYETIINNKP